MELRWYQTYDKNGVDSEVFLQYRHDYELDWNYLEFVREREEEKDDM